MLTDSFGVGKKTVYRDICSLKQAGVLRISFDKTAGTDHRGAFVPVSLDREPIGLAEGEPGRKFLEKIRRLCIFMAELYDADEGANPVALYRSLFPERTERTRQRDFKELAAIGYWLHYGVPTDDEPKYWTIEVPDAFALNTLSKEWW